MKHLGSMRHRNQSLHTCRSGDRSDTNYNDPVAAHEVLATRYLELQRHRAAYLNATENMIARRIPPRSRSLLDIGAGDGTRAFHLARESAIARVVLVEPSSSMVVHAGERAVVWPVRAEGLTESTTERFDVIVCLWNVLGHIPNEDKHAGGERIEQARQATSVATRAVFLENQSHR